MNALPAIGSDPADLQSQLGDPKMDSKARLEEVGRQFEAIFLRQFLQDALDPMIEGSLNEGGSRNGIYRQFMTDTLADSISRTEPFGFSRALQAQMQRPAGGLAL